MRSFFVPESGIRFGVISEFSFLSQFPVFSPMIRTLGLAIAFSPGRSDAQSSICAIAYLQCTSGAHTRWRPRRPKREALAQSMLSAHQRPEIVSVCWEKGNTVRAILRACETQKVDLLLAGAH